MGNVKKKISELTALTSASLDTVVVGVDKGTTYKIELDVLADAVTSRVNILDRDRLVSLESVTSSFETKGRNVISSSTQISNLGFISTSVDITSLNSFTASQNSLNIAYTNGINARLQTSSFNDFSSSVHNEILAATNEQSLAGFATTASNTFNGNQWVNGYIIVGDNGQSSIDYRDGGSSLYLSANKDITLFTNNGDIILNPDGNVYKGSANAGNGFVIDGYLDSIVGDTTMVNNGTGHTITDNLNNIINSIPSLTSLNSATSSYEIKGSGILSGSISYTSLTNIPSNIISGSSQLTASLDSHYVISGSITQTTWDNIANKPSDIVSSSSQLTSSYDTRYTISGSVQPLPNGLISSSTQISNYGFISSSHTDITSLNTFTQSYFIDSSSFDNRITSLVTAGVPDGTVSGSSQLTSSYDLRYTLSGSVQPLPSNLISSSAQISNYGFISTSVDLTSLNNFTSSISTASLVTSINNLNSATGSYETTGRNIISGAAQLPIGLISGSTQLDNYFSKLSGSNSFIGNQNITGTLYVSNGISASSLTVTTFYAVSSSVASTSGSTSFGSVNSDFMNVTGSIYATNTISASSFVGLGNLSTYSASVEAKILADRARLTLIESVTSSYETKGRSIVSGSSQLTSSYDSRYVLSGSITQTTWDNIASKPSGIISGSSQLTSSFDGRYVQTGSYNSFTASNTNTSLNALTSSLATTGSNTFNGTQTISGSFALSGSLLYNGTNLQNGFAFAQPLNTKILNNSSYTGAASWRASYTGNGGSVIVRADVSGYKAGGGLGSLSLYRDSVSVATQTYYFNLSNTHMALPPLTYVNNNETGTHTYEVIFSGISADVNDFLTIVVSEVTASAIVAGNLISGSSQLTASYDARYLTIGGDNVISGSSQLTSSYDTRYTLSGSVSATPAGTISGSSQLTASFDIRYALSGSGGSIPAGTVSGSSQLTSSYDGRYTLTSSFNSFTASAQAVTTGSNFFNGTQTITGSLIVTSGSFVGSAITANTSSLYLTSGSNLYVQNNGLVEITGSVRISGSNLTYDGTTLKAPYIESTNSIGDEGGEFHLAMALTNNTLTGSYVVTDIYQSKLRIFEGGGNNRGVSLDISKTPNSVGGELFWKASGFVNAGSYVSLDNIKATLTTTGNRGLSIAAVSTTFTAMYAGTFDNTGGAGGGSSNGTASITTTPTTSLFGWNFAGQGDLSTFVISDTTNSRAYRITLQIGGAYTNNFIMIERLH